MWRQSPENLGGGSAFLRRGGAEGTVPTHPEAEAGGCLAVNLERGPGCSGLCEEMLQTPQQPQQQKGGGVGRAALLMIS